MTYLEGFREALLEAFEAFLEGFQEAFLWRGSGGIPRIIPNGIPRVLPQRIPWGICKGAPESFPLPRGIPEDMPNVIRKGMSTKILEIIPGRIPYSSLTAFPKVFLDVLLETLPAAFLEVCLKGFNHSATGFLE